MFTTSRFNSTTQTVHGVWEDDRYNSICGRPVSEFGGYTTGQLPPSEINCKKCIEMIHLWVEAQNRQTRLFKETSPGDLYVIEQDYFWTQKHYYLPQADKCDDFGDVLVDNLHSRTHTVCGAYIQISRPYSFRKIERESEPDEYPTCVKCLSSPKVPFWAQDDSALYAMRNRGGYRGQDSRMVE